MPAVDLLIHNASHYLGAIAAVSVLVLIVVAAIRRMGSSRAGFNEMTLRRWIAHERPLTGTFRNLGAFFWPSAWSLHGHDDVFQQLLVLTVGSNRDAATLFNQATAKLLAQIQLAANTAIDSPRRYAKLYNFLATVENDTEMSADRDIWSKFTDKIEPPPGLPGTTAAVGTPSIGPDGSVGPPDEEVRVASRARARIDNLVARKLDALQAQVERGWESANLTAAVWVGMLTGVILWLSDATHAQPQVVVLIVIGAISGFVGHFLGNIVAAIDRMARLS